jgi:16S rRNA pseudouridine516 synthase
MFAATGNHVTDLTRSHIGGLGLEGLEEGQWKVLSEEEKTRIFEGE